MGAWGTAIFDDDFALDIKEAYEELLVEGFSSKAAVQELEEQNEDALDDPSEGGVFWLALALLQLENGTVTERVKKKALAVIATGSDLQRWNEQPESLEARTEELSQLRVQLLQEKSAE